MRLLLTICLLTSCATQGHEGHIEQSPKAKITDKQKLYCELSQALVDSRGWAVSECDGLLFTALRSIGCGGPGVDKFESEVEPGRFYRDPKHACFIPDQVGGQGSDSTISKDMYVGLSAYLAHAKDSQRAARTVAYGDAHEWIVGEAKNAVVLFSKCLITPPLQNVFRKIAGQKNVSLSNSDISGISSGFRAHLDVLSILVRGKIDGSIDEFDLTILKEQARRQPHNALYQAAKARYDDGDYNTAMELLSDESKFPEKQLPNNHQNYCTQYLYERDEDEDESDWQPCPSDKFSTHSGTDFIFAASIVGGAL